MQFHARPDLETSKTSNFRKLVDDTDFQDQDYPVVVISGVFHTKVSKEGVNGHHNSHRGLAALTIRSCSSEFSKNHKSNPVNLRKMLESQVADL